MRPMALAALVLASLATPARADVPPEHDEVRAFPSAAEALRAALPADARVVAFGEFHETTGGPRVESSLGHFTRELLDVVAPRASDIVVETWIQDGSCGKTEEKVATGVEKTTKRPEVVGDELVVMMTKAVKAGLAGHVLHMSCDDYKSLLGSDGKVDFERMLGLTTAQLDKEIEAALGIARPVARNLVVVYGGALHNDVYPTQGLEEFSFAPSVTRATGGHYVEVDLYVPELIARSTELVHAKWYGAATRIARKGEVALVERGPGSYAIVFARTRKR